MNNFVSIYLCELAKQNKLLKSCFDVLFCTWEPLKLIFQILN